MRAIQYNVPCHVTKFKQMIEMGQKISPLWQLFDYAKSPLVDHNFTLQQGLNIFAPQSLLCNFKAIVKIGCKAYNRSQN